jgi:hypothetical protein
MLLGLGLVRSSGRGGKSVVEVEKGWVSFMGVAGGDNQITRA